MTVLEFNALLAIVVAAGMLACFVGMGISDVIATRRDARRAAAARAKPRRPTQHDRDVAAWAARMRAMAIAGGRDPDTWR